MRMTLTTTPLAEIETETLALVVFSKESGAALHGKTAPEVNRATGGWIEEVMARGEFTGKAQETALLHRPAGFKAQRLLLVGGGKKEKFSVDEMRKAAGAAVRAMKGKGGKTLALALGTAYGTGEMVEAASEGALLGHWEPDKHKTDAKKNGAKGFEDVILAVTSATMELDMALLRGVALAEAQNFARDLINEPANVLTPGKLAEAAQKMAHEAGLECEVLDRARMQQLGMGALLGVAQGSVEAPYFIVLKYTPAKPRESVHLGLIGKGVTFDTGGISIKPSDGMEKMKYDMAGAATVVGAMKAIARLKPTVTVTGFAPCVENMASATAQRPGDIVKSLNGKTVEVLNTDAEGRLILIDALTYAIRQGCTHLLDAATLTGAIAVALAHIHAGLFSNNEEMQARVLAAAKAEGEKMWPMPLDEEYKEYLKSAFADIPNISNGRYGGAITAAKFLEEFVEEKPWVHLDIAGTAWLDDGKAWMAKGPSGVGLRTMVRLATGW
jgi:leucyl aminopeptidase